MSRLSLATAFAALTIAAPGIAQPAAASDQDIVVEGQRLSPTQMIKGTINDAGFEALARFEDPVCPGIVGLSLAQGVKIADMIRANIVALGGKIQQPGCTPNATVILVDQPIEFVKQFAKQQPGYFSMTPREFEQFTTRARPVVSWHATETRARDGEELDGAKQLSDRKRKLANTNAAVSISINAQVVRNSAATRLYTNTREDMAFGFVVIDSGQLEGRTLRQLADLATLHLLLDVKQDAGKGNRASILSLFEERSPGTAAPAALSQFDKAMVQGLYGPSENNRSAAQQFTQIATAIRRAGEKTKE